MPRSKKQTKEKQSEINEVTPVVAETDESQICEVKPNTTAEVILDESEDAHAEQLENAGLCVIRELINSSINHRSDPCPVAKSAQDFFLKYGFQHTMKRNLPEIDPETVYTDLDQIKNFVNRYNHCEIGLNSLEAAMVDILAKYSPEITLLSKISNNGLTIDLDNYVVERESGKVPEKTAE